MDVKGERSRADLVWVGGERQDILELTETKEKSFMREPQCQVIPSSTSPPEFRVVAQHDVRLTFGCMSSGLCITPTTTDTPSPTTTTPNPPSHHFCSSRIPLIGSFASGLWSMGHPWLAPILLKFVEDLLTSPATTHNTPFYTRTQ